MPSGSTITSGADIEQAVNLPEAVSRSVYRDVVLVALEHATEAVWTVIVGIGEVKIAVAVCSVPRHAGDGR